MEYAKINQFGIPVCVVCGQPLEGGCYVVCRKTACAGELANNKSKYNYEPNRKDVSQAERNWEMKLGK
jgi:hypothetical protein